MHSLYLKYSRTRIYYKLRLLRRRNQLRWPSEVGSTEAICIVDGFSQVLKISRELISLVLEFAEQEERFTKTRADS